MRSHLKLIMLLCVLALACPAAATAQSGQEAYGGDSSAVAALEGGGGGGGGADADAGLPFTGGDLGVIGGAGALMLALGFSMRRLTRRPA